MCNKEEISNAVKGFEILAGRAMAQVLENEIARLEEQRMSSVGDFETIKLFFRDDRGVCIVDDNGQEHNPLQEIEKFNFVQSNLNWRISEVRKCVKSLEDNK